MKSLSLISASLLCLSHLTHALPHSQALNERQDSSKVGYLNVYWKTNNETVYFALSNNDDPLNFRPINNDAPVIIPTVGTTAIRDTSIIAGSGPDAGKYYIIGTDLDIDTTTWDKSQRTGSRSIFVWESTDLVTWTDQRLVEVEDDTAGMVWAPDAVWDPAAGQYLVHWASRFYREDDPQHTGDSTSAAYLRYAHTSDFKTFTAPQDYINRSPNDIIDLAFLAVDDNTFVRYYAEGGGFVADVSRNGLLGDWTRPAGIVATPYEGPYPFKSNTEAGKVYMLADLVGGNPGIRAWETNDALSGTFTQNTAHDLSWLRHGSVVPVTQEQYDALSAM